MTSIIPSILVPDKKTFLTNYTGLGDSVSMIQLDIADGKFVPNATWADPKTVSEVVTTDIELHLMVNDPIAEMEKWFFVPHVKRVLVHFEGPHDIAETIQKAKQTEWEVGLVLNPGTPTTVIGDFVNDIDIIMFMGVYPGFQGQEFIPETCNRIAETKAKGIAQPISVDGGVNEKTIPELVQAGVDIICPGSAVFGNDKTPAENVLALQQLITEVSV